MPVARRSKRSFVPPTKKATVSSLAENVTAASEKAALDASLPVEASKMNTASAASDSSPSSPATPPPPPTGRSRRSCTKNISYCEQDSPAPKPDVASKFTLFRKPGMAPPLPPGVTLPYVTDDTDSDEPASKRQRLTDDDNSYSTFSSPARSVYSETPSEQSSGSYQPSSVFDSSSSSPERPQYSSYQPRVKDAALTAVLDAKAVNAGLAVVISDEMMNMENELEKEAEREDDEYRRQGVKEALALSEDLRAERMNTLQHLLRSSSAYTKYLTARMEAQEQQMKGARYSVHSRVMDSAGLQRAQGSWKRKSEGGSQSEVKPEVKAEDVKTEEKTPHDSSQEAEGSDVNSQVRRSSRRTPQQSSKLRELQVKPEANDVKNSPQLRATPVSSPRRNRRSSRRNSQLSQSISDVTNGDDVTCGVTESKVKFEDIKQESVADVEDKENVKPDVSVKEEVETQMDVASVPEKDSAEEGDERGIVLPHVELPNIERFSDETTPAAPAGNDVAKGLGGMEEIYSQTTINGEPIPAGQPPLVTGGVLRPYQIQGANWLNLLFENGVNGILGDEMGLGKTVQTIASIAHMVLMGVKGPFMIVAPLSTLPNWISEFKRFTPKVPVILYHGSRQTRSEIRHQFGRRKRVIGHLKVKPVVVTSYNLAITDHKYFNRHIWSYMVVDEGHRLKNNSCRLIRDLKAINCTNRILLTGTPLQNNLRELWSLLNFLLPEIFTSVTNFESWFDTDYMTGNQDQILAEEERSSVLSMLHQILAPFLLRRLKSDVDLLIPPKKEILVYAPLTPRQKEMYSAIIEKTIQLLILQKKEDIDLETHGRGKRKRREVNYSLMMDDKPRGTGSRGSGGRRGVSERELNEVERWAESIALLQEESEQRVEEPTSTSRIQLQTRNMTALLRRCVNHPYLIEHPLEGGQPIEDERLAQAAGKLRILDVMLTSLKARGHKVLIYSQFVVMLDLLGYFCDLRKYKFARLDGGMSLDDRAEEIAQFNRDDSDLFIFLLSTRAGGQGINLTAADTVIIYDSDWNPQMDLQAQDRCHRIGQTRPVVVYRLVTMGTVDQRIIERATNKRRLEKMVIHKAKFKGGLGALEASCVPLEVDELKALLTQSDLDGVVKETGEEVISGVDLEKLLDRSDLHKRWKTMQSGGSNSLEEQKVDVTGVFETLDSTSISSQQSNFSQQPCNDAK